MPTNSGIAIRESRPRLPGERLFGCALKFLDQQRCLLIAN